ncbi:uncharacterized protein LOC101863437 [Aplysia californica]|uniref:Uncharacterized protein LOC101863437 n=1 Tax=Aplysia californica TaxID=6500 RepID=A0ABM1A094_APLCA|nr:uncharacterized protein LOC101863437 [Aplysia californica]
MSSSGGRRASLRSQRSQDGEYSEPWCLTCSANNNRAGTSGGGGGGGGDRTFTALTSHQNRELCDIFSRVLGAQASEEYPSINVCNRCERQLRRLGRYNSIILARHEGRRLREQLEKNLSKYGKTVVESGDILDGSSNTSQSSTSARGSNISRASSRSLRRGRSHDGVLVGRRGEDRFPSRSSSVSSIHSEASIEEERRVGGFSYSSRRSNDRANVLGEGSYAQILSATDRRREAIRRKLSNASTASDDSGILSSTTIGSDRKYSLDNRGPNTVSFQKEPTIIQDTDTLYEDSATNQQEKTKRSQVASNNQKQSVSSQIPVAIKAGERNPEISGYQQNPSNREATGEIEETSFTDKKGDNPHCFDDIKSQPDVETGGLNAHPVTSGDGKEDTEVSQSGVVTSSPGLEDWTEEDEMATTTDDKKTLVARSESLDTQSKRSSFRQKFRFFSIGFNKKSQQGEAGEGIEVPPEQNADESKPSSDNSSTLNQKEGGVEAKEENGDEKTTTAWKGRINPFNAERPERNGQISFDTDASYEDEVFVKGIVDLDDEEGDLGVSAGKSTNAQLFPRGDSVDSSSRPADGPSEQNDENTSLDRNNSLSEVEERINLKTQFKGAYYNIGSTEDLLQELSDEQAAEKAKSGDKSSDSSQTKPGNNTETAPATTEGKVKASSASGAPRKKGGKDQENIPLIEKGDKGTADASQGQGDGDMVFGRKKKQATEAAPAPTSTEPTADGAPKPGTQADDKGKADDANKASPDSPAVDPKANGNVSDNTQVNVDSPKDGGSNTVTFTKDAKDGSDGAADGKGAPSDGTAVEKKSEKSPLISKDGKEGGAEAEASADGKDSKLKDNGPGGILCCSIL